MATTQPDPDGDVLAPVLVALQGRDPDALAQLYEKTADRLYGVIYCIVNNRQDAEDVLSELFLAVWHAPERFDSTRGSVITWLMVMARSRALDTLRRQKQAARRHAQNVSAEETDFMLAPSPVDMLTHWQEGSRVQQALAQLTDTQRDLIQLAFFRGFSHAEIAACTQLPLGTVKSHLRRAQQALEKWLDVANFDAAPSSLPFESE